MNKKILISLLLLLTFSLKLKANEAIIGGTEVDPTLTDTTYLVSIGGICAGNIIAPTWILTAAHCSIFFNRPITAGSVDLTASNRIRLNLKNFYIHPKFKVGRHGQNINDFALIELNAPIDFAKTKLSSIKLATPAFEAVGGLNEGVMATVFGWGQTAERDSDNALKLRQVDVPIVSNIRANAKNSYSGMIDESMLVAGFDQGEKDSCEGDSGGPLTVIDHSSETTLLAGIVSFGLGCARPNYYGVYSKVSFANDWIVKTINH